MTPTTKWRELEVYRLKAGGSRSAADGMMENAGRLSDAYIGST